MALDNTFFHIPPNIIPKECIKWEVWTVNKRKPVRNMPYSGRICQENRGKSEYVIKIVTNLTGVGLKILTKMAIVLDIPLISL